MLTRTSFRLTSIHNIIHAEVTQMDPTSATNLEDRHFYKCGAEELLRGC